MVAVGWEKEGMVFGKFQLYKSNITLNRVLKEIFKFGLHII